MPKINSPSPNDLMKFLVDGLRCDLHDGNRATDRLGLAVEQLSDVVMDLAENVNALSNRIRKMEEEKT